MSQIGRQLVGFSGHGGRGCPASKAQTVSRDPPKGVERVPVVLLQCERLKAGVRAQDERVWPHMMMWLLGDVDGRRKRLRPRHNVEYRLIFFLWMGRCCRAGNSLRATAFCGR